MGIGLWKDHDEANAAILEQLKTSKEKNGMSNYMGLQGKAWKDMTEDEKKADIAARMASANAGKSQQHSTVKIVQPSCWHNGYSPAFTMYDKTLTFAGAKASELNDPPKDTKLIIDLSQQVKVNVKPFVLEAPEDLKDLVDPPRVPPPILKLRWPDREEPPIDIDWWPKLLLMLKEKYSGGRIIISCIGSHGRTGTAMVALCLAANEATTVENAIKFVRKVHCSKAVESEDQVEYLRLFRPNEKSKWLDKAASDRFQK